MMLRRPECWAAVAVLSFVVGITNVATADPYDAALTRAVAAKERALEINDPVHWEETLRLFSEADRIRSTKESKYELAFAAAQMHANDLAVEAYQAALDLGIVGTARVRAEAFVAENAAKMARVEIHGPAGTTIYVSERHRGVLPLARPVVVFAGEVTLTWTRPDGTRDAQRMALRPGAFQIVNLPDAARPEATPPSTVPAVKPQAPLVPAPIHRPDPPAVRQSHSTGISGWPFLIAGVAVAAVGGTMVAVAGSSLESSREELRTLCAFLDGSDNCPVPLRDQRRTQDTVDTIATWKAVETGAWIGVGVGSVAAITGVVLLWSRSSSSPPSPGPAKTTWMPRLQVTTGGAMLLYGGSL